MKKYCYFVGLLVIHPLIAARCSSFTTSVKNNNTYSPPLELTKHTQAVIPTTSEKMRRPPGWQLDDLALLKVIKDNVTRLWHHHQEKSKAKIILLNRRG